MKKGDSYKGGTIISIVGTSVTYTTQVEGQTYSIINTDYVSREDQSK